MLKALAHLKPISTNISRCKIIPAEETDVFAENIFQDQFVSSAPVSAQMDLKSYFKINVKWHFSQNDWNERFGSLVSDLEINENLSEMSLRFAWLTRKLETL